MTGSAPANNPLLRNGNGERGLWRGKKGAEQQEKVGESGGTGWADAMLETNCTLAKRAKAAQGQGSWQRLADAEDG
ncbi:MAG: hypothetical protein DCC55_40695 [Chloroflexi bacterium]|nr:MAG: hypothetical protein DCC55_40695 [Chloroflexota bacterium]